MTYSTYNLVDVNKINRLIEQETGGNQQEFSQRCGHERGWINHIIKKSQKMSNSDILLLRSMFGIDVALKETQPEKEKAVSDTANPDFSEVVMALNKIAEDVHRIMEELIG